jgi:hypothetical protein
MTATSPLGTPDEVNGRGAGGTSPDRVRALVTSLAAIGPRPFGSSGHAGARHLLIDALHACGVIAYRGDELRLDAEGGVTNLVGVVPGRDRHRRPLVLATHYDGPPASPGAGDNGAATALVVALCPRLAECRLERDVIVALLDAGDPEGRGAGASGAEVFVRDQRRHDLKAVVVVDRLGHLPPPTSDTRARPGPRAGAGSLAPPLLVVGAECDPQLPFVLAPLHAVAPEVVPLPRRAVGAAPTLDAFRNEEIASLWLTGGRAPHHRGPYDVPAMLDDGVLAGTAAQLVTLLVRLAEARLPGPFGDHDAAALERAAWQRWRDRALVDVDVRRLVRSALARVRI